MCSDRQKGEGRLGFIVALTVVGVMAFLGFKIIPAKIDAYEFRNTLREECRFGAVRHDDKAVVQRILTKAKEMDLPLSAAELSVRRTTGEMIITARYEKPIDLKVTTFVYKFSAEERAPLF